MAPNQKGPRGPKKPHQEAEGEKLTAVTEDNVPKAQDSGGATEVPEVTAVHATAEQLQYLSAQELAERAQVELKPEQVEAQEMVAKLQRVKQAQREEEVRKAEKGYVFFLQCRTCGGPAVFLAHSGQGGFGHGDWYSDKKPIGADWQGPVPCQICGASAPLMHDGQWRSLSPLPRFIRKIKRSELESMA